MAEAGHRYRSVDKTLRLYILMSLIKTLLRWIHRRKVIPYKSKRPRPDDIKALPFDIFPRQNYPYF